MARVAVVTNTIACLPQQLVDRYGIHVIPLSFAFEDRVYWDGVDITPTEFYRLLRRANRLPTTSAPTPQAYLEAFRTASHHADGILSVTLAQQLSMDFNSAQQAREQAKEELPGVAIEVLDSGTAAGAQGFVVLAAARAAAEGAELSQVLAAARAVMDRVELLGLLDTLHYLAKGGHVPRVAAWTTSVFSIKPILLVRGGEVGLTGRARTKSRAIRRLLELMRDRVDANPVHVSVMHADCLEEAETLKEEVASQFNCVELLLSDFTPVMGVHTGPGLLALAFYCEG